MCFLFDPIVEMNSPALVFIALHGRQYHHMGIQLYCNEVARAIMANIPNVSARDSYEIVRIAHALPQRSPLVLAHRNSQVWTVAGLPVIKGA